MRIFLSFLLLFGLIVQLSAQDTIAVEIADQIIQEKVSTEVKKQLNWLYWVFGIPIGGIVLYAVFTWFWGIKKKVDEVLKNRVSELVDKNIAEITGAKTETIRAYFQEYQHKREKMAKQRVHLVFPTNTDHKDLTAYLNLKGFKQVHTYALEEPLNALQANDILIFDDTDLGLPDEKIDAFAKPYQDKARLFYFGPRQYRGENKMANFANTRATLVNRLIDLIDA